MCCCSTDQGRRTRQGMAIGLDEYGAMVESWWARRTEETRWETYSSATLFSMNLTWRHPGINPWLCNEKPASKRLSHDTAPESCERYVQANKRDRILYQLNKDSGDGSEKFVTNCCVPPWFGLYPPVCMSKMYCKLQKTLNWANKIILSFMESIIVLLGCTR
jgi:hypothetical protein